MSGQPVRTSFVRKEEKTLLQVDWAIISGRNVTSSGSTFNVGVVCGNNMNKDIYTLKESVISHG